VSPLTSLDEVLEACPSLAGVCSTEALEGGLTNENCKVVADAGAFVVRRWSDDTGLLAIDRDHEYENSVRAAEVGVGAKVVDYLPEHNAMVFEFIEGRTMCAEDLRAGDLLGAAADACRRLHGARRFAGDFDMFSLQPRYKRIVLDRGFRVPERYLEFEPHMEAVRDAFSVREEDPVPCNNDLLAGNFLLCDGAFRLIDYEYSGNNDPCFELGNICAESDLSLEQLDELVTAYYGRRLRHKIARARLWGVVARYGWTLWASIQDGVSEIDFDFWAWGMQKYDRAVLELDGADFEPLLDEARRRD
jgi:thiamine kinase-like enzyme